MMPSHRRTANGAVRFAVDIGSTVIKVANVNEAGELESQSFFPRDFEQSIATQVESVLAKLEIDKDHGGIAVCSSANGGLRVGIVCLTKHFSGAALRNQILLAGANPVFVRSFDEPGGDSRRVDMLLIGGGIDCDESAPLVRRLEEFDPSIYNYGTLVYAANAHLSASFLRRFPSSTVIENPLGSNLSSRVGGVFEAVRRAYLDDLVFKEGISELRVRLTRGIRPTPEVVSRGFLRAVMNKSAFSIVGACLALDVGGATTDLHYTVELVREDSEIKPANGVSVARFVFTDLGIVASRDSLMLQLRGHPQLYDFLSRVVNGNAREIYRLLREGEWEPSAELLSYACVFIALDRFSKGRGPGLPMGNLGALSQVILTGGAVQLLDEMVVSRLVKLLMPEGSPPPLVQVDRRYQIWVGGITWNDEHQ
jgi:hypothetical protein